MTENHDPADPQRVVAADSRMTRLFDLRYVIGGLLGVYGAVLVVRGLLDGPAELARAAGTAVNLWTGVALLVVSALFLAWALLRPLGIAAGEDLGAPPST